MLEKLGSNIFMTDFAKIGKKYFYTTIIGLFLMAVLSLTKIIPELSLSGLTVLIGILFFFVLEHFDKKSPLPAASWRRRTVTARRPAWSYPGILVTLLPIAW